MQPGVHTFDEHAFGCGSPAMLASHVAAFSSANSWAAFFVEMEAGSSTWAMLLKWPATVEVAAAEGVKASSWARPLQGLGK